MGSPAICLHKNTWTPLIRCPGIFLFVQLEHCQKCHLCAKCRRFAAVALRNACLRASVRGNLHAAQGPHLLFAPPDVPSGGDPIFYLRGGSEFRLRQGFRSGKNTCTAHCAAPHCGAPGKMKMPVYSSSLSTARNASVGICTLPRGRIFFLPSFYFSSSFFFREISPP